jgi:hypothetical protein
MSKEYRQHEFEGMQVVLTPTRKAQPPYPEANFDGTGWALCGRLLTGETIDEFATRAEDIHARHWAANTDNGIESERRLTKKVERVMKFIKEKESCKQA